MRSVLYIKLHQLLKDRRWDWLKAVNLATAAVSLQAFLWVNPGHYLFIWADAYQSSSCVYTLRGLSIFLKFCLVPIVWKQVRRFHFIVIYQAATEIKQNRLLVWILTKPHEVLEVERHQHLTIWNKWRNKLFVRFQVLLQYLEGE